MIDESMPIQILIVEDERSDIKLALRSLRKAGLANEIHHVRDGEQALDFLFSRGAYADRKTSLPPRVVFLDIKLPKVDGIEVLRQIRGDPRTATLPVVMLTSSQEDSDVLAGYELHANSYIVKPVDFKQFSEAVRMLGMYWVLFNTPPVPAAEATAGSTGAEPQAP